MKTQGASSPLFDIGRLRPWLGNDGNSYITLIGKDGLLEKAASPAPAVLTKSRWIELDTIAHREFRNAAPVTCFLLDYEADKGRPLVLEPGEGLAATLLDLDAGSDRTAAYTEERGWPVHSDKTMPLPTTHCDFFFSARQLEEYRDGGTLLDPTMPAMAARRVGELVEDTLLGTHKVEGVWGLCNHPGVLRCRWMGGLEAVIRDMLDRLNIADYYGPYALLYGPAHKHLMVPGGLLGIKVELEATLLANRLGPHDLVLFQLTPDVVRLVVGLGVTVVQWDGGVFSQSPVADVKPGSGREYKVMTVTVPQVRADQYGRAGVAVCRGEP